MKIKRILRLATLVVAMAVGNIAMSGQMTDATGMDWETNMSTPAVPQKASASVARHMETISKYFKSHGYETRFVRKNEVLVVTIPASELFGPNSTELLSGATSKLDVFERAISHPEAYRIVVAAFADDTGDDTYSERITKERAEVVKATLDAIGARKGVKTNIYQYWFGSRNELVPNNSVSNRARNRRIEVYIIPEERTIDSARSGRLS